MQPGREGRLWKLHNDGAQISTRASSAILKMYRRRIRIASVRTSRFCVPQYPPRRCAAAQLHGGWKERAACAAATTNERGRTGRPGADQQIRLPGPVRARTHGGGVSRGGLVRACEARGCGRDCGRASDRRTAGGTAADRRCVPEYEELPASEL